MQNNYLEFPTRSNSENLNISITILLYKINIFGAPIFFFAVFIASFNKSDFTQGKINHL